MELSKSEKENVKQGNDNEAFEMENHVCINEECGSGTTTHTCNITDNDKNFLKRKLEALQSCLGSHKTKIQLIINLVLAAGFVAMVTAACVVNFHRAVGLLVISLVTIFFLVWDWVMERYGDQVWEVLAPVKNILKRNWFWIRWMVYVLLLAAVVCWLVLDTAQRGTRQLVSFGGLLLLVFLMIVFSKHPFKWSWQTLISGIGLQFVFGLLILRTEFGLQALTWVGNKVEMFLSFTDAGSKFVFGDNFTDHFFVFRVMPILVFLSSVISILYYVGFMPWLICKIGFVMQVTMGTSPTESMVAAGNIFLGLTDSPLLIRPYISELTVSEIHAVMTGGFASISGTILGAFISLGVDATHLLTASLMSAPASLAIAKIFWPERNKTVFISNKDLKLMNGENKNLLEAASQGASRTVRLVGSIITNIIAFLALLAFLDAVLSWLGGLFDYPQLSFSLICSYVFMPLSFMMGVSWDDSFLVAELIGLKTFLNEFVAYQRLSEFIKRREAGGPEYVNDVKQYISVHSETIAIYALCGFSNIASLGMSIGALSAMAPNKRSDISRVGPRALIAGSVACFMTACIAGVLYIPDCPLLLNAEFNSNITGRAEVLQCCSQLYSSVTVHEPLNVTAGGGFTQSSLLGCCALTPPKHFNCSLAQ
ncbi:Solute carrier family 28 member 3 [Oryzias melastigma]|uniref:Sodium/nucleoside cotransporter n=1 Tax=Oryzias melastigma TaxID=30732 RepID=A0A834FCP3_ORYME|nr:Solute carrier family 28 member 3 [Oryzias melastigma]